MKRRLKLWSREHESSEVFLSSSLCVHDRTLDCSFNHSGLFYKPVALSLYNYFITIILSTVIRSSPLAFYILFKVETISNFMYIEPKSNH